ncbi:hypothetical protein ACS126_16295 [Sphingobacterium lactis]
MKGKRFALPFHPPTSPIFSKPKAAGARVVRLDLCGGSLVPQNLPPINQYANAGARYADQNMECNFCTQGIFLAQIRHPTFHHKRLVLCGGSLVPNAFFIAHHRFYATRKRSSLFIGLLVFLFNTFAFGITLLLLTGISILLIH